MNLPWGALARLGVARLTHSMPDRSCCPRQSSYRLSELPHPLERCRPRHSHRPQAKAEYAQSDSRTPRFRAVERYLRQVWFGEVTWTYCRQTVELLRACKFPRYRLLGSKHLAAEDSGRYGSILRFGSLGFGPKERQRLRSDVRPFREDHDVLERRLEIRTGKCPTCRIHGRRYSGQPLVVLVLRQEP